ncbi:hypothetical protein V5O48_004745 [Marasmius crinis-equi]|uniref:MYND-type domain-containing protein n=1 Tax=Marasmius crinis-equi TaxID=585013 RepID=A0ABR3FP84_9AGAR
MLETTTHTITKKDVIATYPNGLLRVRWPDYTSVEQWCYARMDPSTPSRGLATVGVESCTVVILHCPRTQRTILSHSPNFLNMNTFVPMFGWCVGGNGKSLDGALERLQWRFGTGTTYSGFVVEAAVFRGRAYGTPQAKNFGHDKWILDFRELCSDMEKSQSLTINIKDDPRILHSCAIAIEKETGRVTLFDMDRSLSGCSIARFANSAKDVRETPSQVVLRNLFVGNFWYVQNQVFDLHLEYDVDRTLHGIPLPDQARELIRSIQLGEPESARVEMLKRFGHPDWISGKVGGPLAAITKEQLNLVNATGMPCEICHKPGTSKCSRCRGGWYCGETHQREDWKAHKAWCKAHAL